ncbi:MAG: YbfB/YjiJ family MFS transporter [Halopseudomonas yangmingensis]|uniref:Cyanate permease n=1 Tax=Halopseudomonas yangmingensis TaxID=1720063 RepID=A0A1I4SQR8_9GAMM|nr:YbfB/YjiJ family MFS transporter [Halopseudomonas yangmingensis]SFM66846.1 Cyanate permease [Halopseudomonas yangmingensis]
MFPSDKRPNRVITVLCGTLTSLVVIGLARLAYGIILPSMRADLGLSYQQAGLLSTVTALCYVSFVLAGGLAAARWGARASVLFGLLTVALGFVGLALAGNFWLITLLMGLLGFGTAFAFAPMVSLLAGWYPEQRGLVIGCMTSGVGIGILASGLLVPALIEQFAALGWRVSWGVFAAAALCVAAMVALFVQNPPQAPASAAGELPSAQKWLIYRNPRVLIVATTYGIIGMGYIIQTVFMVSFMVESGHSAAVAGRYMAMMGLMSIAAGPLWGWVSDFTGRGTALAMSIFLVILAMLLPLIGQGLSLFFLHFLLMGASVNGLFALIQTSATEQVAPRYIPIAFSFATLFFAVGQFLGPAIAGWLIEITGGFTAAFSLTVAVLSVGFGLTLLIRRFPAGPAVR